MTQARLPDALAALYGARSAADDALVVGASNALVNGYTVALFTGALVLTAAAVITALVVNADRQQSATEPA